MKSSRIIVFFFFLEFNKFATKLIIKIQILLNFVVQKKISQRNLHSRYTIRLADFLQIYFLLWTLINTLLLPRHIWAVLTIVFLVNRLADWYRKESKTLNEASGTIKINWSFCFRDNSCNKTLTSAFRYDRRTLQIGEEGI